MVTNQTTAAVTNALRDIKPPVAIPTGWEWLWWVLGALILLGILAGVVAAVLARRRHRPVPPPPIPAHVRARQLLDDALALLNEPRLFAIATSNALRGYLEERFDFRAPERTTEEFLVELQNTTLLSQPQKDSLGDFLQGCDLVKFAKYEPTERELRDLHSAAVRLVDETEPRPQAAGEDDQSPINDSQTTPARKS